MKKLTTCENCENLEFYGRKGNGFYGCSKGGFVVPHSTIGSEPEFYRVPMQCPRPDSEVVKKEAK